MEVVACAVRGNRKCHAVVNNGSDDAGKLRMQAWLSSCQPYVPAAELFCLCQYLCKEHRREVAAVLGSEARAAGKVAAVGDYCYEGVHVCGLNLLVFNNI